ncbi:MAG TPA: OsmC family peroxiredoxin [Bacteroidetes bacterium]|nr:OsmC family peroxiredoxin [Bacteroidota bacterium]
MKRTSSAIWNGTGKEGKGSMSSQSNFLNNLPYTWASRFENANGTNPEELIAAAHAGCYSMKLSFLSEKAGFKTDSIETSCTVNLENGVITNSHLIVKASIPGCSADQFQELANDAKANCPISKSLSCEITIEATLI